MICEVCEYTVNRKVEPRVEVDVQRGAKAKRLVVALKDEDGHALGSICRACLRTALSEALRDLDAREGISHE